MAKKSVAELELLIQVIYFRGGVLLCRIHLMNGPIWVWIVSRLWKCDIFLDHSRIQGHTHGRLAEDRDYEKGCESIIGFNKTLELQKSYCFIEVINLTNYFVTLFLFHLGLVHIVQTPDSMHWTHTCKPYKNYYFTLYINILFVICRGIVGKMILVYQNKVFILFSILIILNGCKFSTN